MADDKKVVSLLQELVDILKTVAQSLPGKTVNLSFVDNGDGTISDKKTGLMWEKEGSSETMVFSEAEKYCKDLRMGEHRDWRLPTLEELFAIVDYKKNDPAIDPIFKSKSSWYWTSTDFAGYAGYVWCVSSYSGGVYWDSRYGSNYVRAVRQYN